MSEDESWRSETAYNYIDNLTPGDLAWEFLRRNPDYRKAYQELVSSDLPLVCHPAAIRASAGFTPCGVGLATGDRRSWSGLRSRSSVAVKLAA